MKADSAKSPDYAELAAATCYQYHNQTKHTFQRLLESGGSLDWANQPDPFRIYDGASVIELSRDIKVSSLTYLDVLKAILGFGRKESACETADATADHEPDDAADDKPDYTAIEPGCADADFVSNLLYYSMSISAWKQIKGTEHRWALRCNASSGNLHPTEAHLLVHSISGLGPGIYHYRARDHCLELRARTDIAPALWKSLTGVSECPPLIVLLSTILWREIWKYRQRGFRYCQHDSGHALGSMLVSAWSLGWQARVVSLFPDQELASIFGLETTDEKPSLLIGLSPAGHSASTSLFASPKEAIELPPPWPEPALSFGGSLNRLSAEVIEYPLVEEMYRASCYTMPEWRDRLERAHQPAHVPSTKRLSSLLETVEKTKGQFDQRAAHDHDVDKSVHRTIRRRRSAVDMDGQRTMNKDDLAVIMTSSTRGFAADFQSLSSPYPEATGKGSGHHLIHLYLWIHRVEGLRRGVYYFDRAQQELLLLNASDQRERIKLMSCIQDIAADGCLAVSMIADLKLAYDLYGNRGYRIVHFEAGVIGQLFYLSAAALGHDSTGIGCFVDDAINEYLALPPGEEVIYNFTFGRAVEDPRLTSLSAYGFRDPALP